MWQTETDVSKMMFSYPLRGTKSKKEIAKRDQIWHDFWIKQIFILQNMNFIKISIVHLESKPRHTLSSNLNPKIHKLLR
jgi:hypothetical protein